MIRAVMWDLDGTILDSRPGIFHSIEYALNALSLPIPSEEERMGFLGPPIDIGFSKICRVPDDKVADAIRLYREYYTTQNGMYEASLYDGVCKTVSMLRDQGIPSYVTTSKPELFANRILEHFGVASLFDGIYGATMDGSRAHKADVLRHCMIRHGLNADDSVLVGDRLYDVRGAKALSIPCIGVLYGYGSREELTEAGAMAVIESPNQLFSVLQDL